MEDTDPFAVCEEEGEWGAPSRYGWLSPRISFSQDFAMLDRWSPEKRKREEEEEEDANEDDGCSEFEFCSFSKSSFDLQSGDANMLPADQLFSNGQLRPLQIPSRTARCSDNPEEESSSSWSSARHLSFESSRSATSLSIDISRQTARRACLSLDSSRCSSPSRSLALPPATPTSPKVSSNYSSKFKEFFKLKKLPVVTGKEAPSSAELVREHHHHGVSSSCRLPISPRSFWPFSRSNSAGEKSTTPVVTPLPRRSNSAGESKTNSSSLKASSAGAQANVCMPSIEQGRKCSFPCALGSPLPISNGKKGNPSCSSVSLVTPPAWDPETVAISSPLQSRPPLSSCSVSSPAPPRPREATHVDGEFTHLPKTTVATERTTCPPSNPEESDSVSDAANARQDATRNVDADTALGAAARVRGSGSPGRLQRRVLSSPARNFARGSPGRRGVWNSPGRGNASRIVLKNLERCSAGTKVLGRPHDSRNREAWKGSERPNPYPAYSGSVRVTPVLNVPACMAPSFRVGKASRSKVFNFKNLFSRKEKSMKSASGVLPTTYWRNGG